jgi:AAA+ ATPase superfamily predicted ATPase
MQSPNPYYNYNAVRDLSLFFGRARELQILFQAIQKHQSVSIVGIRHIGKSSLLKYLGYPELQQQHGYDLQKYIFILTDWREYLHKKREDFFHAVCDEIIKQSQQFVSIKPNSLTSEDKFRSVLENINNSGFYPILLMDAFDRVTSNTEFDPRFFSFLRSLAGVYDLISYITTTMKPLHQVCHSNEVAQSPFFNIFVTCLLGPLALEEARELIASPAQQAQCPFTISEFDWLLKVAGRHPFFLQIACRHLFEEKVQQKTGSIDFEYVQGAIYQELLPHFDKTWEDLEEEQKANLKLEIFQKAQSRYLLSELTESQLFCKRVQEMSQNDLTKLSIKDIRDALDHLDNADFLATSKLSTLQFISSQINNVASMTSARRGILVQTLLKKAFENMKPDGFRSDSAPDWKLYNILWYHYFKYNLPNNRTAARLGFGSMRQFYRDQDRAIQALLKEVLEIEATAFSKIQ